MTFKYLKLAWQEPRPNRLFKSNTLLIHETFKSYKSTPQYSVQLHIKIWASHSFKGSLYYILIQMISSIRHTRHWYVFRGKTYSIPKSIMLARSLLNHQSKFNHTSFENWAWASWNKNSIGCITCKAYGWEFIARGDLENLSNLARRTCSGLPAKAAFVFHL